MGMIKKKSEMKQKYLELGLKVAKGRTVKSLEEAIAFADEVGLPIIAKPDIGVGAEKTYKIEKIEDFHQVNFSLNYFVEEFIQGQLISFDGFADTDGEIVFYTVDDFSQPVLEVANHRAHIWYYSLREIPEEIRKVGFQIVKGFNLRERFFHIEFFQLPDGSLVNLEINCRPPGGFTMDMFNYANDVDLYNFYAKVVCGKRPVLEYNRPYHALYVSRKGHYKYKYTHEEIMTKYPTEVAMHRPVPLGLSLLGDYCYIFRFKQLEDVRRAVQTIWASPDDDFQASAPLPLDKLEETIVKSQ
jgi:biotin carboxylase